MRPVDHVVVAVPARNEEELVGRCLVSVTRAARTIERTRPRLRVSVVVALDGCTDGTAAEVARLGVDAVHLGGVGVGAARDAAVRRGLEGGGPEDGTWIACTDADTVVPPTWLHRQIMWADRGMDLVVGTVEPDAVQDPRVLAAWHARHQLVEGHQHVHGANLGVRASAWRAVGGFGALRLHEDVDLVERLRVGSRRWVATDTTRVRTSGRSANRVEGGFAGFLLELGSDAG